MMTKIPCRASPWWTRHRPLARQWAPARSSARPAIGRESFDVTPSSHSITDPFFYCLPTNTQQNGHRTHTPPVMKVRSLHSPMAALPSVPSWTLKTSSHADAGARTGCSPRLRKGSARRACAPTPWRHPLECGMRHRRSHRHRLRHRRFKSKTAIVHSELVSWPHQA